MSFLPGTVDLLTGAGLLAFMAIAWWFIQKAEKQKQLNVRIARMRNIRPGKAAKGNEVRSLRRQQDGRRTGLIAKLRSRLEIAGMVPRPEKYLAICGGVFTVTGLLLAFVVGQSPLLAGLIAFALGFGLPHFYVGFRMGKRKKKFLVLFPDGIDLIVRGLRAGLPVAKSMQTVSVELSDPVGPVFREMVEQVSLGVNLEKALADMAIRLDLTEFNFFITSIILQRETGGNLAEILANLSEVLKSRTMMRLKIRAMTSEARASAYIVGALPFGVMAALAFLSPDYLQPLFHDYRGNEAMGSAAALLAFGVWVMMRMAKFEI